MNLRKVLKPFWRLIVITFLIGLLPINFSSLPSDIYRTSLNPQNISVESSRIGTNTIFLAATNLKLLSSTDLKDIDAHALKQDFVGKSEVSKFDIYVDDNGRGKVVLVKKSDTKTQVETGLTVQQAKDSY